MRAADMLAAMYDSTVTVFNSPVKASPDLVYSPYSELKRYSDDSTDARDDVEVDDDDDDDDRRSPDSDRKDDDENRTYDKKVYRCQHCKYTTDRKNNLKRHVITMHETCSKVLECCDVVFKNKASLRDHVLSCHKNGYDCRICGRTFCRKALLKRHITVHSGQKDYVCSVCGYATSHKSNLDRHKRRHGTKLHCNTERDMSESVSPPALGGMPPPSPQPPVLPQPLPISKLLGDNFWWSVFSDPIHQVVSYTDALGSLRPYYHKQHRHKASLLAKRLLYTYNGRDSLRHSHDNGCGTAIARNEDAAVRPPVAELKPTSHAQTTNKNLTDKSIKSHKISSKRRLYPGLYRCHDCGVTFDHQLQLHKHFEHDNCRNVSDVPSTPLTRQSNVISSFVTS